MPAPKVFKPHIHLGATGKRESYTSPIQGGTRKTRVPHRNRQQHGQALLAQLQAVTAQQAALAQAAEAYELESIIGIQVDFQSFPGVDLAVERLADARQRIELLNVTHANGTIRATLFVPEGKLTAIEAKLQAYLEERKDQAGHARDYRGLIDAIQAFRVAVVEALWTDADDQLPQDANEPFWWEVWLPVRGNRQAVIHDFKLLAEAVGIQVPDPVLEFPECSVMLAKGNRTQFASSGLLLNAISELRRAKETAAFFDGLPPEPQSEWADELLRRLEQRGEPGPFICLLDTGANQGHPLLAPFLEPVDQFTLNEDWTGADDNGHGTGMAGLAIWGDLTGPLGTRNAVRIDHRLESVKVLRKPGDNEGKHLGVVTADGVSLPEIQHPRRTRVFTMALSATDSRDRGRPSAWSGAIDSLAADALGENAAPRLFALCAGNASDNLTALADYPNHNLRQDIHDPGQAWNALTVGAYTDKTVIAEPDGGNYQPLAPEGGLSPYSTTSVIWEKSAPIKPEVVFEGGNIGKDPYGCIGIPSLKLLTTHYRPTERLFTTFEATSAATALAGRFAAAIYAQYPDLWPETVRALVVHSAQWTDTMRQQFDQGGTERQRAQHRVRCVGFGVPDLERALWSTQNSLALIVEDGLQPFAKEGGNVGTRDMHLHDLPWPKEALQALGDADVEMMVTLSYFIEPNPSSRNVTGKYRYPSHQLRFDVKRPLESIDDFRKRINRQARDEEEESSAPPGDPGWLLGAYRHKGSIHKDVWRGKTAELAERGQIAVYPAMGWWRTRARLERYDKKARYALVVSIETPETEISIYNEVAARIAVVQSVTR